MAVATVDPKKAKAKNLALVKTALKRASKKGVRVGFAFAPGKDKRDHILMIDPRKNAKAVMTELAKAHKDRRQLCCGTATVIDENGKKTLSIIYVKKLAGAERKIQDALKILTLRYVVKLETDDEDEDIAEAAQDEESEADDETADDADDETADDTDDESDDETADADDTEDDEDDDETADETEDEDDERGATDEDEDTEDDEQQPAAAEDAVPAAPPASAAKLAAIGAAPQIWSQTQALMSANVEKLKASIKSEYAGESPELIADIDNSLAQIDKIVARFDHSLGEQLKKAHQAADEATRKAELAKAKAIVAAHIKYVTSEPLIAHIDSNPFGVDTSLKKVLTASLTHMAKVIS